MHRNGSRVSSSRLLKAQQIICIVLFSISLSKALILGFNFVWECLNDLSDILMATGIRPLDKTVFEIAVKAYL